MMMKLYLVGMPGSGKSTLGKPLAKALQLDFLDLDQLIVEQEQRSIPEIFQEHGEAYFREAEHRALVKTSQKDDFVLATGGGAPCFHRNMTTINAQGISIYLEVGVAAIADRVIKDGTEHRPLFSGLSKEECQAKIEQQLRQRASFYEQSILKVTGDSIGLEELLTSVRQISKT